MTIDLLDVLRFKSERGTVIRVLVGDPDSVSVKSRAEELDLVWLPDHCRKTATYLGRDLAPNSCVRTHGTTLYASQFRFDDTLLINLHAYAAWASQSPVLRLDCAASPLFQFYADAFDRIWRSDLGSHRLSDARGGWVSVVDASQNLIARSWS